MTGAILFRHCRWQRGTRWTTASTVATSTQPTPAWRNSCPLQHAGDWGAATQEHVAFLLSIADLVQRLRDARAKLKMTCAATADYLLMLREHDEVEAGADEVNHRMAQAAESLCRLFRYRLPVRVFLSGLRDPLADSEVTGSPRSVSKFLRKPHPSTRIWRSMTLHGTGRRRRASGWSLPANGRLRKTQRILPKRRIRRGSLPTIT